MLAHQTCFVFWAKPQANWWVKTVSKTCVMFQWNTDFNCFSEDQSTARINRFDEVDVTKPFRFQCQIWHSSLSVPNMTRCVHSAMINTWNTKAMFWYFLVKAYRFFFHHQPCVRQATCVGVWNIVSLIVRVIPSSSTAPQNILHIVRC